MLNSHGLATQGRELSDNRQLLLGQRCEDELSERRAGLAISKLLCQQIERALSFPHRRCCLADLERVTVQRVAD